jgi:ATP-dependent RNA helicase DDX3X
MSQADLNDADRPKLAAPYEPLEIASIANTLPKVAPEAGKDGDQNWPSKTKFEVYDDGEAAEPGQEAEAPTWAANAQKYEWMDEYGDIGPPIPELERQLFGADILVRSGNEFSK